MMVMTIKRGWGFFALHDCVGRPRQQLSTQQYLWC